MKALTQEQIHSICIQFDKVMGEAIRVRLAGLEFAQPVVGPDDLRKALRLATTGQGSYGPNYNGEKLGSLVEALACAAEGGV